MTTALDEQQLEPQHTEGVPIWIAAARYTVSYMNLDDMTGDGMKRRTRRVSMLANASDDEQAREIVERAIGLQHPGCWSLAIDELLLEPSRLITDPEQGAAFLADARCTRRHEYRVELATIEHYEKPDGAVWVLRIDEHGYQLLRVPRSMRSTLNPYSQGV